MGRSVLSVFASEILFLDTLALVKLLLALCQGNEKLCISVFGYIESDADYGQAFLLYRTVKFVKFLSVEQKFAVALGVLTVPSSGPMVFGNVHILDIEFIAGEIAEAIHQRGLACPDGLYLRSGKDDAGLECFQELKVEGCSPVFDLYVALCLWHISLCWRRV